MTTTENGTPSTLTLQPVAPGIWAAPGARIIDRTGRKMLPTGRDGFVPAAQESVVVDKTMLIADVLDSGYTVTLFLPSALLWQNAQHDNDACFLRAAARDRSQRL